MTPYQPLIDFATQRNDDPAAARALERAYANLQRRQARHRKTATSMLVAGIGAVAVIAAASVPRLSEWDFADVSATAVLQWLSLCCVAIIVWTAWGRKRDELDDELRSLALLMRHSVPERLDREPATIDAARPSV